MVIPEINNIPKTILSVPSTSENSYKELSSTIIYDVKGPRRKAQRRSKQNFADHKI